MKHSVIIVAGGSGTRMGAEIPKQFLELKGKCILAHTLEVFYQFDPEAELIVVLPKEHLHKWQELKQIQIPHINTLDCVGGATRFLSVSNGLALCSGELIAVHDAVRPCVSVACIASCFDAASKFVAAVPVIAIHESIRKISESGNHPANRDEFRMVQTPQCFQAQVLKQSFQQAAHHLFTDDAQVVEAAGYPIYLCAGQKENIKITVPQDLALAEIYLSSNP